MNQNEHVRAIDCQPEVAGAIISGEIVKTIESYAALNFEVHSFSSFWDIKKNHFVTAAADVDDSIKWKCIRISLKKN